MTSKVHQGSNSVRPRAAWAVLVLATLLVPAILFAADSQPQAANAAQPAIYNIPPRAYVTNRAGNAINVFDVLRGKKVSETIIPNIPTPQLMAFTLDGKYAYVTTYESNGPVYVIDVASNSVFTTIPVGEGCHDVAMTIDGKYAWVTDETSSDISVIDIASSTVVSTFPVGQPSNIAFTPDGQTAYVTSNFGGMIYVIDTASQTIVDTLYAGNPIPVVISPDGTLAFVGLYVAGQVLVIRTSDNAVIDTIQVPNALWSMAITPNGKRLFAGSENSTSISVISTTTFEVKQIPVGHVTSGLGMAPYWPILCAASQDGVAIALSTVDGTILGTVNSPGAVDCTVAP